jgi:uncharacterized membrane protein YjfL (UPF0719 family)
MPHSFTSPVLASNEVAGALSTSVVASNEVAEALSASAFFAGTVALVLLGWWVRDRLAFRGGESLARLITERNHTPVAIEAGSFLLASVMALLGSILLPEGSPLDRALAFAATGGIVVGALLVTDQLLIRLILPGLDVNRATRDDHNVAVALVRAGAHVAAALVIRAALHHDSPLWERLVWVLLGQGALVLLVRAYQAWTPWDDVGEVRHRNIAAAVPLAGLLLATGVIVAAATEGEGHGWAADLTSFGVDLLASAMLFALVRALADRLLIRGSTFAEEIARDKNVGAGFIEAAVFVATALGIGYFLN